MEYRNVRLLLLHMVLVSELHSIAQAHDDDHDGHAHVMHEKASFRYSREANEHYQEGESTTVGKNGHGHSHDHHGHSHDADDQIYRHVEQDRRPQHGKQSSTDKKQQPKPQSLPVRPPKAHAQDTASLWLHTLGATLLISLAPFLILFFVPVENTAEHQSTLKVLLSFASGGLLGDAFLHLIPHAIMAHESTLPHSHSHSHSHDGEHNHSHDLSVWLFVLTGFGAFLLVEKFVRFVKGPHQHFSHGHAHESPKPVKKKIEKTSEIDSGEQAGDTGVHKRESAKKNEDKDKSISCASGDSPTKQQTPPTVTKSDSASSMGEPEIKVAGYLNLAADVIHNFTDGLAIGASFLAGKGVGIVTTVTVLFHEVPHEIGDYAILIQSGCTRRQAMMMQLLTAVGAFSGAFFSLIAEGIGETATAWILPFTAGGFIYIATVSVIPELLDHSTLWQSVKEILALVVGVGMMVVVAYFE